MTQQQEHIDKYDYLKAKYIFRYPFTFTSIKWSLVIGSFFGLHTYIKHRDIRLCFRNFITTSVLFTFPIWAYFMVKYSFYQSSIQSYQQQDDDSIRNFTLYQAYMQMKLGLPANHNLNEQQVISKYNAYLQDIFQKNSQLDVLLRGITAKTFD